MTQLRQPLEWLAPGEYSHSHPSLHLHHSSQSTKHKLSQSHCGVSSLLLMDSTSFFFLSLHTHVCVCRHKGEHMCTSYAFIFSVKKCVGTCVYPRLPVEGWQRVSSSNYFPPYSLSPELINWASLLNQHAPVIISELQTARLYLCTVGIWGCIKYFIQSLLSYLSV